MTFYLGSRTGFKHLYVEMHINVNDMLTFTLREGHRLRVFENRVLWRIFGPRRDKVT
jgi:hypothetical protein